MKKVLIVIALIIATLFALTSCDKADEEGGEPPTLDKRFDRTTLDNYNIRLHVFSSRKAMQEACAARAGTEVNLSLDECAEWAPHDSTWGCDLYLVDIRSLTDNGRFSAWGHGLAHCMYGAYHDER